MSGVQIKIILMSFLNYVEKGEIFLEKLNNGLCSYQLLRKKKAHVKYIIAECVHSYGGNCRYRCSVHCINQTCDRFNGRCLFGCIDGKTCNPGK